MNKREIDECILKSFKDFASELLKLAPELAMDRNALVKAAIDRSKTMVGLAREQRMSCYRETAAAIDDNSSSARDIAVLITKQCRSTSMQVAQTMADSLEISFPMSNTPPSFESILSVSKDLSNPDDLISFVLEQRSARKRANRISPKPKPKPVQGGQTGKLEV